MDRKDQNQAGYQMMIDVTQEDECLKSVNGENSYKKGNLLFL